MQFYFMLTATWLIAAVGLLVYHYAIDPDATRGKIGGFSLGWVALVMGLYSLARWWSYRAAVERRRAEQERHDQRKRRPRETAEPDPNSPFNFGTESEPRP